MLRKQKYSQTIKLAQETLKRFPDSFWAWNFLGGAHFSLRQLDPAATCWSNFKILFAGEGLGYSYDLRTVTQYYRLYQNLMAFWRETFGNSLYDLDYDQLTMDQEGETRKLINYVGVDWQDACLAPHKNDRSVNTASQVQVRQAVYKNSSQSWRKFEPFLDGAFDGPVES